MHFGEPWVLFLLWGAPLFAALLWALHRRGARRLAGLVDGSLRAKILPEPAPWRGRAQFAAVALGLLLALLAAAAPRWGYREERVLQRGRDLVIALDVSRSMLARDVQPSRLERARRCDGFAARAAGRPRGPVGLPRARGFALSAHH